MSATVIEALIVDDEAPARARVREVLADEPDIVVVGECTNGREAIAAIEQFRPDLMFLDVQMPEVTGFDVLRSIPVEQMPSVVFTTAYDQHAVEAFEYHALDYLLKPFKQARFKAAVQRVREHLAKRDSNRNGTDAADSRVMELLQRLRPERSYLSRFVIKDASRVLIVKASEVDWIESAANYALLHAGDRTHIHRETMRSMEEQLCPSQFLRVSRSAIVNLERIKELRPMMRGEYVIVLQNGKQLTMTRGIRELQRALSPG